MDKSSFLLTFCLMLNSCDDRNEDPPEAKENVMKTGELDSYMAITNYFDKENNYSETMPYALKMQNLGIGHYDFYRSHLMVPFDNKFDIKNILKMEIPEREFLIYILHKGAKNDDSSCKEVLIQYYKNGWGVTRNIKKADSLYKSLGILKINKPRLA